MDLPALYICKTGTRILELSVACFREDITYSYKEEDRTVEPFYCYVNIYVCCVNMFICVYVKTNLVK